MATSKMIWTNLVSMLTLTTCMTSATDYGNNGGTKLSHPTPTSTITTSSAHGKIAIQGFTGGWTGGVIPAAIQTRHNVEVRPVNLPSEPIQPAVVLVDAGVIPLTILFRSMSSALNVMQQHVAGQAAEPQHTKSEDEPHMLLHEVSKPIIQEVREVISPYRRVVQHIEPVQEEVHTIVARGQLRHQQPVLSTGLNSITQPNNYGSFASSYPTSNQPNFDHSTTSFTTSTQLSDTNSAHNAIPTKLFSKDKQATLGQVNLNSGVKFDRENTDLWSNKQGQWNRPLIQETKGSSGQTMDTNTIVVIPDVDWSKHDKSSSIRSTSINNNIDIVASQNNQDNRSAKKIKSKLNSPAKNVRIKSLSKKVLNKNQN